MSDDPKLITYKQAKSMEDINFNMCQMITVFNHNSTQMAKNSEVMANDLKWIKRFVFGICAFFMMIVVAAVADSLSLAA